MEASQYHLWNAILPEQKEYLFVKGIKYSIIAWEELAMECPICKQNHDGLAIVVSIANTNQELILFQASPIEEQIYCASKVIAIQDKIELTKKIKENYCDMINHRFDPELYTYFFSKSYENKEKAIQLIDCLFTNLNSIGADEIPGFSIAFQFNHHPEIDQGKIEGQITIHNQKLNKDLKETIIVAIESEFGKIARYSDQETSLKLEEMVKNDIFFIRLPEEFTNGKSAEEFYQMLNAIQKNQ